jgi:hypothetical protein
LYLPVFGVYRVFMSANKALVSGFLFGVLSACTVSHFPGNNLSLNVRVATINEPAQNMVAAFPVLSLELRN